MKKKNFLLIITLLTLMLVSCDNTTIENDDKKEDLTTEETYLKDILDAYNYHINANYFKVEGTGVIETSIITQNLRLTKEKKGDELYYFNASYGKKIGLSISSYVEATGTFSNLNLTKGSVTKDLEKNKESFTSLIDHDTFKDLYGVGIDDLNYIFKENTVNSIDKKEGLYILKLDLDKSTVKYRTHINETNPYETEDDKTQFSHVELHIKLDDENRFKEIKYFETYKVRTKVVVWINQELDAEITEYYYYNN